MFFPRIKRWLLGFVSACLPLVLLACGSTPSGSTQTTGTPLAPVPTISTAHLTYNAHLRAVNTVMWSPDGKDIASSTSGAGIAPVRANNSVKVWDATTGQTILTFTQQDDKNEVNAVAWSPDSKRIATGSDDETVRIWEVATGHTDLIYRGHGNIVLAVAWSPDGKEIASSDQNGAVRVWQPGL